MEIKDVAQEKQADVGILPSHALNLEGEGGE